MQDSNINYKEEKKIKIIIADNYHLFENCKEQEMSNFKDNSFYLLIH